MEPRTWVAREAARLLYTGAAEEYIQAKEQAAASLGVKASPSNYEVADELDRLADELEGSARQRRLAEMRDIALRVMKALEGFSPRLIGSVWRGTAHIGSDIDVVVLAGSPVEVAEALSGFEVKERGGVTFKGGVETYHFRLQIDGYETEVVVRRPEGYGEERCDIYGDLKRGLTLRELERLLRSDPQRRFVPRRRIR